MLHRERGSARIGLVPERVGTEEQIAQGLAHPIGELALAGVRRVLLGDRTPFLAQGRRRLAMLEEIGPQPRPAEPSSPAQHRQRHRCELDRFQALARVLGFTVSRVSDA